MSDPIFKAARLGFEASAEGFNGEHYPELAAVEDHLIHELAEYGLRVYNRDGDDISHRFENSPLPVTTLHFHASFAALRNAVELSFGEVDADVSPAEIKMIDLETEETVSRSTFDTDVSLNAGSGLSIRPGEVTFEVDDPVALLNDTDDEEVRADE